MIPPQLHNPDFRFIKIRPDNKKAPLEQGWTESANYRFDDPTIVEWIREGNNYGVATGFGDLVVIDSDSEELKDIVDREFPPTFTVQTGGGGFHYYYICPGQEKIIFENGNGKHLGELQSKGQQVVGPECIHPNGKFYEVHNEHRVDMLNKNFISILPHKAKKAVISETEYNTELKITDVIPLSGLSKKPSGEYQGAHPIHGKTTPGNEPCNNFTINPNKNVWHCFAHHCGGGPLSWIALQEGIISCGDELRGDKYFKTVEVAKEKYGLREKQEAHAEESVKEGDYIRIKADILEAIQNKERGLATEIMVKVVHEEEHIYTILDDKVEEVWIYHDGIYTPNGISKVKEKIRDVLGDSYTTTYANQVMSKIMTDTYIDQNDFFNNNIVEEVVVANGVLDLKTHELRPFSHENIAFTKIPHTYDPEAKCPNMIQFFKDVLKSEEDLPVIQELFGYLLWKEYNIERAFMLIGTGRNGKGKTIELMKRFIGFENYSSIPLQNIEGDNFHMAELHKKLANLCGDIDDRALKFTGSFKNLTGRDNITANRKFKTQINFENYAKMIFAANTLPRTHDISDAFFMRWVLLEFPYTFYKEEELEYEKDNPFAKLRDPNIINKISTEDEFSGLLNWALEGLRRLQERKDFTYSKTGNQVKDMWLRKSDSFMAFCLDTLEEEYGFEIPKAELRHVYNSYCKKHKLKPVSDKSMKYTLTSHYGAYEIHSSMDDGRVYVWVGVNYKPTGSAPHPQQELDNV